jgi:tetratricopeptide (TPR) repeat protein
MVAKNLRSISVFIFLLLSPVAFAAGGGGGGGGSSGGNSNGGGNGGSSQYEDQNDDSQAAVPKCKKGFVYSKKSNSCVKMGSELIPDEDLYRQGRTLALAGQYEDALPLLAAVKKTDDAMVYTMLGFTTRKLGRWDEGMAIYQKALGIDPSNPNTHEYIGEAYLFVGRVDLARLQLEEVEKGCGNRDCSQYVKLAQAIETGIIQ